MSHRVHWSFYVALLAAGLCGWIALRLPPALEDEMQGAPPRKRAELKSFYEKMKRVAPLFGPLPKPEEGDWLDKYPEGGQTFDQYVAFRGEPLRAKFSELHVIPLGDFTPSQLKLLDATREFMELFFEMDVRVLDRMPLDDLPDEAQRLRDNGRRRQLLTTHLLEDVLKPLRAKKAAALLGFVAEDLYPGEDWNYVFGQASINDRVGVWSLYRNGNPDGGDEEYRLCLVRTLKTAVHETGHMLGMPHCIAYSCCMNGSNNRDEADRKPLEFCPECQAKVWWTCRADPVRRSKKLGEFAEAQELAAEAKFWRAQAAALGKEK